MRILLVEDDAIFNENEDVQKGLKRYGYTMDRLTDGNALLSFIKIETFEVIILDLSLLSTLGISILRNIRAKGFTIPVLILTRNATIKNKAQAFENGADGYLDKPVDLPELSARIRVLQRRYSNNRVSPLLTYQDIKLNSSSLTVRLKAEPINFSRNQFSLLQIIRKCVTGCFSSFPESISL